MTPFALMQRIRRGGQVTRYHTHRLIEPPSNAEHMWNVAMLCWQLDPELDRETLLCALLHDVAEYDTGDMPAFVKRSNAVLREELARVESTALARMGLEWVEAGDDAMHALIKVADYLDNVLTALDERRRGNTYVDTIFHRGVTVALRKIEGAAAGVDFEVLPAHWTFRASKLLGEITAEYREIVGDECFERMRAKVADGADYFARIGDPCRG